MLYLVMSTLRCTNPSIPMQGKGVGKALLQGLEVEAQRRGYAFIRLNSAEHRIGAHAFYEQVGYTCDKLQKRFIKFI